MYPYFLEQFLANKRCLINSCWLCDFSLDTALFFQTFPCTWETWLPEVTGHIFLTPWSEKEIRFSPSSSRGEKKPQEKKPPDWFGPRTCLCAHPFGHGHDILWLAKSDLGVHPEDMEVETYWKVDWWSNCAQLCAPTGVCLKCECHLSHISW